MSPNIFSRLLVLISILFCSSMSHADGRGTEEALQKALAADVRSAEDKARDASRKPAETLTFLGIKEDMRVLELVPGKGWYTKILNHMLSDQGQLYVAIGTQRLDFDQPAFEGVEVVGANYKFERTDSPGFVANLSDGDFGIKDLDLALTFRNAHNLTSEARRKLNKDVFNALAPGGIYGVIDHTKRHMAPNTAETWRRADPVQIIKEALDAGFVFEDYSNLHYRPSDSLEFDTQHETIKGDSDRFTLKFRKPE